MDEVFQQGKTALVTGGADGIGFAAARRFASAGMNIVIADVQEDRFDAVADTLMEAGAENVVAAHVDVSDKAAVVEFSHDVITRFGGVDLLMANAGIQPGSDIFDESGTWDRVMAVNLGGIVNVCQTFVSGMLTRGAPGMVIATGSKQGITTPPGDPAYNVAKSGVKTFTEALAHDLREKAALVSVHLMIPGFVFTELNRRGRDQAPPGAWSTDQVIDFMMESLARGDFYILCPDNDVTREMDEKRMAWAVGDIIENRPPLSRWHGDWGEAFQKYMAE